MMQAKPVETRAAWIALVLSLVAFVVFWLAYRSFWLDDAFITFRYARHWAEGLGPVFNAGERVEGYTTFSWLALSALAFAALSEAAALNAIKLAGLALGAWILVRTWSFPSADAPARRPAVLLLATHPVFVANTGHGMETPLFTALALECARALVRPPRAASGVLAGGLCAALVLTRPEALPLLLCLPALVWLAGRGHVGSAPDLQRFCAGFAGAGVVPVALHFGWRLSYYGAALPNSYVAKATGSLSGRLGDGLDNWIGFLGSDPRAGAAALWLGLALALVWTLQRLREPASAAWRTWLAALWGFVTFRFAFDLWSGSETIGFYRFLAPVLPFVCVLADEAARRSWHGYRRLVLAGLAALALAGNGLGHALEVQRAAGYERGLRDAHTALGLWLRERHPPGSWLALGDAGAVPFFSRMNTIDMWGINDAAIARLPGEYGNRPGAAASVLARDPEVIVLWNRSPIAGSGAPRLVPGTPADRDLFAQPAFGRRYRFAREFVFREERMPGDGYYLDVFERR